MKKLLLVTAISATFAAGAVQAQEITPDLDLSFNVAATSNYVSRGASLSDGIALQGGADLTHSSGVYAGTWMSSISDMTADLEVDVYVGYAGELENGVTYDLGLVDYIYPNESTATYAEAYVGVGYGPVSATYYNDITNGGYQYLVVNGDVDLGEGFGLGLQLGYADIDGDDDVVDYGISLSKTVGGVDLSLALSDTDADGDNFEVAFTVGKTF